VKQSNISLAERIIQRGNQMRIKSLLLILLAITASLAIQAQEPDTNKEFRVDSDASWLRVLAYPDGPLRRFGHHHVISHHGISGTVDVASNPLESTITLELAVRDLQVDDPALRALEGEDFEGEVPQKDIDGTRANMLGENLLHGDQFPTIQIQSTAIEGSMPDVNIVATFSVKGMEQTLRIPASIELTDDSFVASGQLEIMHGELGLSPFTAMGGALSVRDLLVLKYKISGAPITESE
jgi:polyisoprenoid-binding protein YceI